jgi:hypothetical protein
VLQALHAYPEPIHAVLAFLRDYAEVQVSTLRADEMVPLLQACHGVSPAAIPMRRLTRVKGCVPVTG